MKIFAAIYGDEAAVTAMLEAPGAEGVLIAADRDVNPEDMLNLNHAMALGETAGIAIHRAALEKRGG